MTSRKLSAQHQHTSEVRLMLPCEKVAAFAENTGRIPGQSDAQDDKKMKKNFAVLPCLASTPMKRKLKIVRSRAASSCKSPV